MKIVQIKKKVSPVNSEVLVGLKNIESPECKSILTYEWKIREDN